MKIFTKILFIVFAVIGILFVFGGAMTGMDHDGISTVLGGGIYIAFGVTIFVLNRD